MLHAINQLRIIALVAACAGCSRPAPSRPAAAVSCPADLLARTADALRGREAWCEDAAGIRQGPYVRCFHDGRLAERSTLKDGMREGAFETFYPGGARQAAGHYVHGLADGAWTGWHIDGRVWFQGSYRAGRREGRWLEHDVDGATLFDGTYRSGVVDGAWRALDVDGRERAHGSNHAGRLEGELAMMTRNGQWRWLKGYRDNRPHGRWVLYRGDRLVVEMTYVDGVLEGSMIEYDETGAVKKRTIYEHGVAVKP